MQTLYKDFIPVVHVLTESAIMLGYLLTMKLEHGTLPLTKPIPSSYSPRVCFALWNACSIKNKLNSLSDFMTSPKIDISHFPKS